MGVHRLYKGWSPYHDESLAGVDYAQTADVIYTVHLDYPEYKLTRSSHIDWAYEEVTYGPTIDPPSGTSIAATTPNTTGYVATTYRYVVTAVKDSTPAQESRASAVVSVNNDLTLSGNFNTLTLPSKPAGVDRYIVYKEQGGAYGYVGGTEGTTFRDGNPAIQPVLSDTPPIGDNPFTGTGNYPSAITFHQQRKFLGRTKNVPNGIWGTQSADLENMDKSRPAKADDAMSFALVSNQVNAVNQLASLDELMVLSEDAIWSVTGSDSNVITQTVDPKKQSNRGASRLKPLEIDNVLFFRPTKGSSVRTLGFTFEIEGYRTNNISLFSPHLFEQQAIMRWAFQEEPYACVWAVTSLGALLCFTWEQEQQVWGWTPCEVDGYVHDVAVITEGGFDRVYIRVTRTIAGVERTFYERMALPHFGDITTACHLDCSITQVYDPPRNIVDQLWHLEGEAVSAHYDGYAVHDLVVENGQLALPNGYEATIVTVGLRYSGEIETLPGQLNSNQGTFHTNRQQIDSVVVRTIDTKGIKVGANGTELEQVQERDGSEVAELPNIDARDYPVTPPGNWTDSATIRIVQDEPFPAHVVGIFYDMKVSSK